MVDKVVAGTVTRATRRAAEGGGQEEILHVDDDERSFGRIDCDWDRGRLDGEGGSRDRVSWGGRMREVEAVGAVVEPEVWW